MNKLNAGLIANTPIFLFAFVVSWHPDFKIVPKDDLLNLIFGVVFGVLIFPASLLLCNSKINISKIFHLKLSGKFVTYFLRCTIITALIEEYVWRYVLISGLWMLKISSLCAFICSVFFFFIFHFTLNGMRINNFNKNIDLLLFSVLVTGLYFYTQSLLFVIGTHTMRNAMILMLRESK